MVRDIRGSPYGERRARSEEIKDQDMLVKYAVWVEAAALDKDDAAFVCRILKLVHSMDEFLIRAPQDFRGVYLTLTSIQELASDLTRREKLREALVPRKEQVLTVEQRQGYLLLQALEAERKSVLGDFDQEERRLLESLRALRRARDNFGSGLTRLIPQWGNVHHARDVKLTTIEREGLVSRFNESVDLQQRYTLEAYLAAARANKIAQSERSYYDSFRGLSSEANIRRLVRQGQEEARQPERASSAGGTSSGRGAVEAIAPV